MRISEGINCPLTQSGLCTSGAKPNLHLIPMTTDLTNIPADFKVLASGISGPEGPAIGPDGELYLVSAEDASIIRVSPDGDITQVAETKGRPNGLVFNKAGEMYVADADLKAILRIDADGKIETFVDGYQGTALGGPNDLCFLPNGDLFIASEGAGYQGGRRTSRVEPDDNATVGTGFGGHMDVGHRGILQSGDA